MSAHRTIPIALSIAGSDSGGGAGIQADLKTFSALGVHGVTAITCVTAQTPVRVLEVQPCSPSLMRNQLDAILGELAPAAAKTGMLYSETIIRSVVRALAGSRFPLVVDPVIVSTSGSRLLKTDAIKTLCRHLLPIATLVTPNLDEAGVLVGMTLRSVEDMRRAAKQLQRAFGCAALVKGGHLRGSKEAVDIFYDGREELLLSALFIRGIRTHGTGCTYSAAITAYLAKGVSLKEAVARGKEFVTQAIEHSHKANGHWVLNSSG